MSAQSPVPSDAEPNAIVCVLLTILFVPVFAAVLLPQYVVWRLATFARRLIGRSSDPRAELALVDSESPARPRRPVAPESSTLRLRW